MATLSQPFTTEAAKASQRFYRPELDALRFFAFLCVFLTHYRRPDPDVHGAAWALQTASFVRLLQDCGVFGMLVFFLLSSYLITELLLRERERTGTVHLKAFYARRVLRIWPLYLFALAACAVIGRFVPEYWLGYGRFLAMLLFAGNWYVGRHGYGTGPYGPLWSISLEEQFYLLWPTVAKWMGPRSILLASVAIIPISLGTLAYRTAHGTVMQPALFTNSFVQFLLFALGAILALVLKGQVLRIRPAGRVLLLSGGLGLWLLAEGRFRVIWAQHISATAMTAGFLLAALGCVLVFLSSSGASPRLFPRFLVYSGKISYGLYVYHMGAMLLLAHLAPKLPHDYFVRWALILALTIAMASLSYRYLESPFLRLKERFAFVKSRPA